MARWRMATNHLRLSIVDCRLWRTVARTTQPSDRRSSIVNRQSTIALFFAVLCAFALVAPVGADPLDDRVRAIAKELRCPVCEGETVADSNSPVSVQMRGIIRQKLEAGESREQILAYFAASYGEGVLAEPPPRGFTLGVWVAPVLALITGLVIVGAVLRSWYRGSGPVANTLPTIAPPAAIGSAEDERLERELERFRRQGARG